MRDLPQLRVFHLRLTFTTHLTYPSVVDIELTLKSGQLFSWEKIVGTGSYILFHRGSLLRVTAVSPTTLELRLDGDPLTEGTVNSIMGKDLHGTWLPGLPRGDTFLKSLVKTYRGLTLLKQDPYECLISFLSSGMSTMVRTRRNLAVLRKELGIPIGDTGYSTFPAAGLVAGLKDPEKELRKMGFGYRAPFITETCRLLDQEGTDLKELEILNDDELRTWLRSLPGVGQKIAECVLLFSFGRLGAFPVDVWVMRALQSHWPSRVKRSPEYWSEWARDRWGTNSGFVQQLLFMWARDTL